MRVSPDRSSSCCSSRGTRTRPWPIGGRAKLFGSRRFVSCVPLFVLSLAALFSQWEHRGRIVAIVSWPSRSTRAAFQYQLFLKGWRDVAPYPVGVYGLLVARFVVPFRVLGQWLGG